MNAAEWTHENLATQGYCLTGDEAQRLRVGLRFPTALCLALVITALVLQSALLVALLVPVGLVAVCGLVTATNFCIPSTMLAWLDARRRKEVAA
jgi:hypothetical protein